MTIGCREENNDSPLETITSFNSTQLVVISPKLGDIWFINNSYEIRWIPSSNSSEIIIHLYRKHTLKKIISSGTENDGSFIYYVPPDLQTSNLYRLKFFNPKDTNNFVFSQYFSIRE